MSQTTAPTTARPRPRPKAKPKPAAPKDGSQPSSSSISLKEEDKLFMRNLSPVVQTKPKGSSTNYLPDNYHFNKVPAEKKQRKVSNERQTTASPSKAGDWKSQKNFSRYVHNACSRIPLLNTISDSCPLNYPKMRTMMTMLYRSLRTTPRTGDGSVNGLTILSANEAVLVPSPLLPLFPSINYRTLVP